LILSENHITRLKQLACEAGTAILDIYNHADDFGIEQKEDESPLTIADKKSNDIICRGIEALELDYPIISEENLQIPYKIRKNFKRYWLVDPLDGTKEFIKRNGDFTVNIALIEGDRPVAGFVYAPFLQELYWAISGQGAYFEKAREIIKLEVASFDIRSEGLKVVASGSHLNEATLALINKLNNPKIVNRGSSLKFLLLAKAEAQYYPRMSQTMEWDLAAGQIILEEAGGKVLDLSGKTMLYNKESMKVAAFIASGNGHPFID